VDIHETSLEKVRVGLPAVITIDALAGKKFLGRVERIAPLPDARSMWANPDLKIYPTDIYLEGSDNSLRTGMSCKAEIIIAQYEDAVYIPVQAVLRVAGQPTVYVVNNDGSYTERKVEIGLDDNNMIRIASGLEEGEVVLMTPPLRAATLESGARISGVELPDGAGDLQDRVNQKLEEANGSAARPQQQGQSAESGGDRSGSPGGFDMPSQDQMDQMRGRFENMTDEERQKAREQMRQRFENMSEEEREAMRQRFQRGGGSRQGRGQRQGETGRRQGTDSQSPPGAERNQ
jgi:hypothetical protein